MASNPTSPPHNRFDAERIKAQLRKWQERLLDLTKSNPLLGLNRSRVSKLKVTSPLAGELFKRFVIGDTELRLPLVRKRARAALPLLDGNEEQEVFQVEPGDVEFEAEPPDLMRRLRRIHDNARTSVEERGVTTLFLTFGALRWQDDRLGESTSPLWIVPCVLTSKGPNVGLRLSIADEEMQLNPALEVYLREQHKLALPPIDEEPEEDSLRRFLNTVGAAVREQKWSVAEEVWLGTFSFESLVIYQDLKNLADVATFNPIVAAFSGLTSPVGKSEKLGDDLDSFRVPDTVPIPILATDSSQLEALTYSVAGRNLVIHGPPGTGKSQTISNLIADALGRGKKVLFVSAKMAALNIVYDRLARKRLGRFCLEAHSTKAGKAKIIEELRRTLEADMSSPGTEFEEELDTLLRTRERLNEYVRELHRKIQPLGRSVYQAIGKAANLHRVPDVQTGLPWENVLDVARAELDKRLDVLSDLAAVADVFNKRRTHPWRGFTPPEGRIIHEDKVEADLREVANAAALLEQLRGLAHLVPDPETLSFTDLELFLDALDGLAEIDRLPDGWWNRSPAELEKTAKSLRQIAAELREFRQKEREYRNILNNLPFTEAAELLTPIKARFSIWYWFLLPSYWSWRSRVRQHLRYGTKADPSSLRNYYELARRLAYLEGWFKQRNIDPTTNSEQLLKEARRDTVAALVQRALSNTHRTALPGITDVPPENKASAKKVVANLPCRRPKMSDAIKRIDEYWPEGFASGHSIEKAPLQDVLARTNDVLAAMPKLHEWLRLQAILKRCRDLGLGPFIDALSDTDAKRGREAFERRFYRLWVNEAMQRSSVLGEFSSVQRKALLEKFCALDDKIRRLGVERIHAAASDPALQIAESHTDYGGMSEVGILRHELQKKKRLKPLRKLFAEIPHVLQALKPCMLMSPVSVSTFLKPGACEFDLVVFDEASQLPTAEAVPPILRAKQVIVAGDSNQLPPTSFFEASVFGEAQESEDELVQAPEPLESLLDECMARVPLFQEAHLRWHYRSRDERLIKFSNHYFYDNRLTTFPTPSTSWEGRGVHFVHVPDGIWDRGRSRTNRPEARKVAELIVEHLERFPDRSLGVVAMSFYQREAIEDALYEKLQNRPDLAALLEEAPEPFFVKSLENVQGDERDTMIISVGYGKDAGGHLTLNFGPLNMEGGWRRLNVLVTRAKWQTILVSSMRSHELAGVNPQNRGALALKNYLEYAERRCELPPPPATLTGGETNDFEDAVCEALRERGLHVDQQVGASKFRIDLAVRDRRDPSRYVLGIECDGATYHSSRTARDRDLLRQQVLTQMGWRIHRVWSTEWFHDRDPAIDSIFRSLERAEAMPPEETVEAPPLRTANDNGKRAQDQTRTLGQPVVRLYPPGRPYQRFRADYKWRSTDILLKPANVPLLAKLVVEIVGKEGPIHEKLVAERLKEIYGIDEISQGSNAAANIVRAIESSVRDHDLRRGRTGWFLFKGSDSHVGFRVPGDGVLRPLTLIAPEEIEGATLHLIEDQFGLMRDKIPHAVGALLGVKRVSGEAAGVVDEVVDDLLVRGILRLDGNYLCLAR